MPFKKLKESNLTAASLFCLAAAILLSVFVLSLWVLDMQDVMKFSSLHTITKFNTAFIGLLSGISILLLLLGTAKKAGILLSISVLLITVLTIAEHLFHLNAGIDELIFKDPVTDITANPGRMNLGNAIQFFFLNIILLGIAFGKERVVTVVLLIPLWTVSFLITTGYLFQMGKSFTFSGYSRLSPFTVLILFFLTSALFFGRSEDGFLAPFTKKTTAAKVNRRALILSILLTLLFSWFRLQGELSGFFLHDFGIVLMGLFIILMLLYTTRSNTGRLNSSEELIKREKELTENMLGSIPGIFYLFNREGKILRQNKLYTSITGYTTGEVEQMHPLDFFEEEDKKTISEMIAAAFQTGSTTAEAVFCTKGGKKIPMFFTAVKMNYDGEPCIIGTGIDISERKKAEHEVQLVNAQLRDLTKHMEHLREEERLKIAHEIHDELGQQLTVLKMNLSWLQNNEGAETAEKQERFSKMVHLTEDTIQIIRKISFDLRPPVINDLGLAEALKQYSNEFENQSGIKVNFYTELEGLALSSATSTALYRIYQECLTNIVRYAEATVVESSLDLQEGKLLLSVSDNGKGFAVEELKHSKTIGVVGMRERAFMIGGTFVIHSEPGEGTHIQVTVPLTTEL